MNTVFVIVALVAIVAVNAWLMKVDLNFWRNLFAEKGKRHKKVRTDR